MSASGFALMGVGRGFGKTRAEDAATAAISSPLLEVPMERARRVVFSVTGGPSMTLQHVNAVAQSINTVMSPEVPYRPNPRSFAAAAERAAFESLI